MANRLLVLYIRENGQAINRLGISISKKVGGAVIRNRIKRLIKEQFRLQEGNLLKGYDLVIVVRPATAELEKDQAFNQIGASLQNLLNRQKIRGTP